MRFFAISLVFLFATAANASAWELRHLAHKAGTRALLVNPVDAQFAVAGYGTFSSGKQVTIGCVWQKQADGRIEKRFNFGVWVGGGPDFGRHMYVEASFPDGRVIDLGELGYARGNYWGHLHSEFIEVAVQNESLMLAETQSDFTFEVPSTGLSDALDGLKCRGEPALEGVTNG